MSKTLAYYRTLINAIDPKGSPTAQLVYQPQTPSKHIGILDASFNPVTCAHEALLDTAQKDLNLDGMLLMLSGSNVDKEIFGAPLDLRLLMLIDYAHHRPATGVALCSHARFVDKIRPLSRLYPDHTQFYFIVGYDTLIRLFDPKYYTSMSTDLDTLFAACHFIAANRGPHDRQALAKFINRKDAAPFAQKIHPITLPESVAHLSSTTVRDRIRSNQPIDDMVPQPIAKTIAQLQLYRN